MIMDYKQVKADVLKQYDAVMPIIKEIKGNSAATFDTLLNQLQMGTAVLNATMLK